MRTQEKADAGPAVCGSFLLSFKAPAKDGFPEHGQEGARGFSGAFSRLLGLFCFACCWNEWAPPLFSMKEPQAGYAQTDPIPPHPGSTQPGEETRSIVRIRGWYFYGPQSAISKGTPPAGPPRTPGKWDILCVFIFLPRSWGVVGGCRYGLACVWFWGSLQPCFGPSWNLWPSSW